MAEYTPDDEARMADDISSIIMRARYGRTGVGKPSDNPLDQRDARRIVEYIASRDARVRRDAAREALDGLASELMEAARDCAADGDHGGAGAWRNASAYTYRHRDTHYPEAEDQT